jgi:hypothetical protein
VRKQRKPPPLTLFPYEWVPLGTAFAQIVTAVGSVEPAEVDINRGLRSGLLKSALRQISRSGDGEETRKLLKPADWQQRRVRALLAEELTAYVTAEGEQRPIKDGWPKIMNYFFVRHAELNKYYPATPSAPTTTGDHPAYDTPRQKPGKKAKDDWPMLVASKLIYLALHDAEMLENIDGLVRHIQDFLEGEIGWAPKDPQAIRKKIVFLLQYVRR